MTQPVTVLVVDDEFINREMLVENLSEEGYEVIAADSGEAAWQLIDGEPRRFSAILLDRMMPDIDGIEILRRIQGHRDMQGVPVIMQTGMTADNDVRDGLEAGAYYYLTKPFSADTLLAIVAAAVRDYQTHRALADAVARRERSLACLVQARFLFRTPEDARNLATLAANAAPDPARVVLGLSELMLNAIEHGNLGIGYALKSELIEAGRLFEEIERMLGQPEHAGKVAELEIMREGDVLSFTIRDQGPGFDWQGYLELSPERAFDTHGRGIAMSRMLSFDGLEFLGAGNVVRASIRLA